MLQFLYLGTLSERESISKIWREINDQMHLMVYGDSFNGGTSSHPSMNKISALMVDHARGKLSVDGCNCFYFKIFE